MDNWQLIVDPPLSGQENMQKDLQLFHDFEAGKIPSTLRIYSWKDPCISLGYSQKEEEIGKGTGTGSGSDAGWEVIKRPTGGGIVFHTTSEVTYSLVTAKDNPIFPKGLIPSYMRISEAIVTGLHKIGIDAEISKIHDTRYKQMPNLNKKISNRNLCFSHPEEYEIVYNGKKIVGSAQKRGKIALLQQGTILVDVGFDDIKEAIIAGFETLGIRFEQIGNRDV